MTDQSTDGPGTNIRLTELAELAEACRISFLETASQSDWLPANGSVAAKIRTALRPLDPAGFDLISDVVVTYLEIAAGHLGGLAALYRSREAMFPPLPLVRAVLELTAHAMWVIGKAPADPSATLARAYLEEFISREAAKQAAGRMGSRQSEAHQQAAQNWSSFRTHVLAVFPGATAQDLTARTLGGQTLPGLQTCVEEMFDHLGADNAGITRREARGVYDFLSAGTHPSLYQARQLRRFADPQAQQGKLLSVDIGHLERLLAVAVTAYYNVLSYVISFYGLNRSAHDALTATIDCIMPSLFRD